MDSLIQNKCFKCNQVYNLPNISNKALNCKKCSLSAHKVSFIKLF